MLRVVVYINQTPIIVTSAVRITGQPNELCTYCTDDGSIVTHQYDDGAEMLAIELLRLHRVRETPTP